MRAAGGWALLAMLWCACPRPQRSTPQEPALDFALPGLDGKTVSLASFRGAPVVVDFAATWCGPCVETLPRLEAFHAAQKGRSRAVVVFVQDEPEAVQALVTRLGVSLPVALDGDGAVAEGRFGVRLLPSTFVLDRGGRKVFAHEGVDEAMDRQLNAAIEQTLRGDTSPMQK